MDASVGMDKQPRTLQEFPGQEQAKTAILPSILAAQMGKPMPHTLLVGPPGTGKTTLAHIIATELGGKCHTEDARNLKTLKQFLTIVHNLRDNDVLFVDEIHGLDGQLEELLYGIVDKFGYLQTIGASQVWVPLRNFVLVGATTKPEGISAPMRTRFGITAKLEFYDVPTLMQIARHTAAKMGLLITEDAAEMLAIASRGTARTMTKLLDRADDYLHIQPGKLINAAIVTQVLNNLGVDRHGFTPTDRKVLKAIKHVYGNQPVGLATLAAVVGESEDSLAETVEPFLLREGVLMKTARGRILTDYGLEVAA
jgi:Holliday junction DNA helicase RuvB